MLIGWKARKRRGFTLVEVLIVVVILAVLAATVVPQYRDVTGDAKYNTTVFNLQAMRAQIELYKAQHDGTPPGTLADLTISTDVTGSPGVDFGPYLVQIPDENIVLGDSTVAAQSPIAVTVTTGGWVYDNANGEVRINHTSYDDL